MADTSKGMGGGYTHDRNCYRRGGSCACGGGVCGKEVRATPPSPSTAPEAWVYECKQPGDDKDKWAEFFSRNKPSDAPYIRNARPLYGAALASRPAEVDDEGLPPLPDPLADRARMPDPTEISDAITEAYNFAFAHKDWQATDYWRDLGKRFSAWAASSHTTNKEK